MFRSVVAAGVGVVVLWLMAGCTKRNPAVCCTTEEDCERSGLPTPTTCEDALVCLANSCQPPPTCQADSDCSGELVCDIPNEVCAQCLESSTCGDKICDASTHSCRQCESDDECTGGFCSTVTKRCLLSIVPNYMPDVCNDTSGTDLMITTDTAVDTSDAAACNGGVLTQPAPGPEICVLHYRTLFVQGGFTLSVRGSRAIALVADTSVSIGGTLDLDATGSLSGPGGGTSVSGGEPGPDVGGGGAGFAQPGGDGGTNAKSGRTGNNGGEMIDVPRSLLGGPRAGGALGGGGGGAATVIACRGATTVTGMISANGGGAGPSPANQGAAGGGAGGYVALQGRTVVVNGRAFANGATGGGGGDGFNGGPRGVDGPRSSVVCAIPPGNGGSGGCLSRHADAGGAGDGGTMPGGGGGSIGYLSIFTTVEGATVSPSDASPIFIRPEMLETR